MKLALAAVAMLVATPLVAPSACTAPTPSAPAIQAAALGGEAEECPLDDVDKATLPPMPTTSLPGKRTPPPMCQGSVCLWQQSDTIYGQVIPREGSYYVVDGFLYEGDQRLRLRGVNWFGLETEDVALHGLWSGRDVPDFLDQMVDLGFDAIRLPLAPKAFKGTFTLPDWAQETSKLTTSKELLDQVITEAAARDIRILLDFHTCDHTLKPAPGRPDGCPGYSVTSWLNDLGLLADLAAEHDNVIGIDLFNEPYDLLWGEWADLAARAARAVLERNPRILVFVQGAWFYSAGAAYDTIYGESLVQSEIYPPDIPASRLVYAPHAYGPDLFRLNYLDSDQYPAVLPHVWDLRFGHAWTAGHGFVIGEFGGHYDDDLVEGSVDWQDRFVSWLRARGIDSFFYWCWNPNSGNTGGILEDDWETANPAKMALLRPLLED